MTLPIATINALAATIIGGLGDANVVSAIQTNYGLSNTDMGNLTGTFTRLTAQQINLIVQSLANSTTRPWSTVTSAQKSASIVALANAWTNNGPAVADSNGAVPGFQTPTLATWLSNNVA